MEEKSQRFLESIQNLNLSNYRATKKEIKGILGWLWEVIVDPVLSELGFCNSVNIGDSWPRIWWVGSRFLNILPIHAAGYHEPGDSRNCLDRVISSYSPSIKALLHSRNLATKAEPCDGQNVLLVGMPTTPNKRDLPYAKEEIDEIIPLLAPSRMTVMWTPEKKDLLAKLRNCQLVHFACHGELSVSNPSQSLLLLQDWNVTPLTVSDLLSLNIQKGQLAYLSACNAASSRHFRLLDESIHLAAACQQAGFPSVIGSLWRVDDSHSSRVARDVYKMMYTGMGNTIDTTCSAEALHLAVRKLRNETQTETRISKQTSGDPLMWAPYIHVGA